MPTSRDRTSLRFGDRNGIKNLRSIAEGSRNWRAEGASDHVQSIVRDRFAESMNPWDAAALFWWARNMLYFERSLDPAERRDDVSLRRAGHRSATAYCAVCTRSREARAGVIFPVDRVSAASVARGHAIPLSIDVANLCEELLGRLEKTDAGKAQAENARCG